MKATSYQSIKNVRNVIGVLGLSLLAGLLGGCGDGEAVVPKHLSQVEGDAEDARIQKLLSLRVWNEDLQTWEYQNNGDIFRVLAYRDYRMNDLWPNWSPPHSHDLCPYTYSNVGHREMSAALGALRIAESVVPVNLYDEEGVLRYRIPPQEVTARVALFYLARRAAKVAWGKALEALEAGGSVVDLAMLCNPHGMVMAEELGEILSLAYDTYIGATEGAVDSTVKAGDALKERAPSPAQGRAWQYAAQEFSRLTAAHLLIGGTHKELAPSEDPFCSSAPLAPDVRKALSYLRIAAPNPVGIVDETISLGALLGGNLGGGGGDGTVAERLAAFLPLAELGDPDVSITESLNLTVGDFAEARAYMAREIAALHRSMTAELPATDDASFVRYASTGTNASPLSDDAYGGFVRYSTFGDMERDFLRDSVREDPLNHWSDPSLEEFRSSVAYSLLNRLPAVRSSIAALDGVMADRLESSVVAPMTERLSRIRADAWGGLKVSYATPTTVEIRVMTDSWTEPSVELIRGTDGLRCLETGTVEGAPCVLDDYIVPMPYDGVIDDETQVFRYVHYFYPADTTEHPATEVSYLVENLSGTRVVRYGFTIPGFSAASAEEIGGNTLVFSDSVRKVENLVSLSSNWCGQTAYDCLGNRLDERLPLENELSSDAVDIESSWRGYLEMAKEAANEAEARGKEYFDIGLQVEERKESVWNDHEFRARAAVEDLQQICGTAMDPRRLRSYLAGGGGDIELIEDIAAECADSTECSESYQCIAGQCILDFNALPEALKNDDTDLSRLAECISSDVVPFATPGDKPLCLWVGDNENAICEGATAVIPCPVVATGTPANTAATACVGIRLPAGLTMENVRLVSGDALLSYFETQSTNRAAGVCGSIRALRAGYDGATVHGQGPLLTKEQRSVEFDRIVKSYLFHPEVLIPKMKEFAPRLDLLSNISIDYRGETLWTTGKVGINGAEASGTWPCGASGRPPDCSDSLDNMARSSGLFCDFADCADPSDRAAMVSRLLEAARVVRNVVHPHYTTTRIRLDQPQCDDTPTVSILRRGAGLNDVLERRCSRNDSAGTTTYREYVPTGSDSDRTLWWWPAEGEWLSWPDAQPATWVLDGSGDGGHLVLAEGSSFLIQEFAPRSSLYRHSFCGALNQMSFAEDESPCSRSESGFGWGVDGILAKTLRGETPYWSELRDEPEAAKSTLGFGSRAFVDAAEMICEIGVSQTSSCAPESPPAVSSVADLGTAKTYLECVGQSISEKAGKIVLAKVPRRALDALRKQSAVGAFPSVGGQYSMALSQLRGAMVELSEVSPIIAYEIRQLGNDIDAIRATLQMNEISKQIADVQFASSLTDRMATCASDILSGSYGGFASCANALAQIEFLGQLNQLQKEQAELAGIRDLATFRTQFETRGRTLASYASRILEASDIIDTKLAELESLRLTAQTKAADAVFGATYQAPNTEALDNALAWRYYEARRNYEKAAETAQVLATTARRAIEQRLGIRLADMMEDLPLVSAPSGWVNSVCKSAGMTFEDIEATNISPGAEEMGERAYEPFIGTFIGEYVSNLELTVESYRMVYPFQDGVDESVVSVRNDLSRQAAYCWSESLNRIPYSNQPGVLTGTDEAGTGWRVEGCPSTEDGILVRCLDIGPLGVAEVDGRDVPMSTLSYEMTQCPEGTCSDSELSPRLSTTLELEPGWYGIVYHTVTNPGSDCAVVPRLYDAEGTEVLVETVGVPSGFSQGNKFDGQGVLQYRARANVPDSGNYRLEFGEAVPGVCTNEVVGQRRIGFGGPMLWSVTAEQWDNLAELKPVYQSSDRDGLIWETGCSDVDGVTFRTLGWSAPRCLRLCQSGYADACDDGTGQLECYRELRFRLDDSLMESGDAFQAAGFARGNYNYRLEQIGVNFVGTGVKDCADSDMAEACYGNGSIQYTLEHKGPFFVRNHLGNDVQSLLFSGRIEHARGLATERYLTNPLSNTDRDLLAPYLRNEFQGRPMGGEYVLRVWVSDEINFDNIEDVQFFWRYRYWTRQN